MPRLLFATDFHGNQQAYDLLFELAQARQPDAIVLGGDLCPYPHRGMEPLTLQRLFVERWLRPRVRDFSASCAVPIIAIPGNDDCAGLDPSFRALEDEANWHWIPGRSMALSKDWSIAGLPLVPVTPFFMSDYDRLDSSDWEPAFWPEDAMFTEDGKTRLEPGESLRQRPPLDAELATLAGLGSPDRTIYVLHSPPYGTALDQMHDGRSIGSRAIADFIEREQPPLTLHGHIHESPDQSGSVVEHRGRTTSFNPGGSLARLQAVLVDVDAHNVQHELILGPWR